VGLEGVTQLSLSHVKDTDVALLSRADEGLVLGGVHHRRTAIMVARECCKAMLSNWLRLHTVSFYSTTNLFD